VTRVLIVDHTAGIVPFQRKFTALAAQPGIELTVLAPKRWVENYRDVFTREGDAGGYRVLTAPVLWPGYENRGFYRSGIARALRIAKPDLLHLWEEPYSFMTLQSLVARRWLAPKAPVIFSSSDDRSLGYRYPYRPSWLYGAIERFTLRRAAGAAVINEGVRSLLGVKGFRRPIELITHGLDLENYPDSLEERAARSSSGAPAVIGYFGRLTEQKGVDLLLRAFRDLCLGVAAPEAARAPERAPGLRIVGDGPVRDDLVALARELGIADRVRFSPTVPHGDAPRVLAEFDVLVLPARTVPTSRETFGRVLIEGMAAGCVVIGSNSGAIPDVIADAGLVFPEEDVDALRNALMRTLTDRALAADLRARGRERVRERYTWDGIGKMLAEFYWRVLAAA